MADAVAEYYDEFTANFIRDYVDGNLRVARQRSFLRAATPPDARAVLVLGCGSGETCLDIARNVARGAQVLGVDISPRAVAIARQLCPHPRVRYEVMDVTRQTPDGAFDVVFLPDVYEHIPKDQRQALHQNMARLLTPTGRVLVTSPYPGAYWDQRREAHDMQIIDEDVFLPDMIAMARDLGGELTHFQVISVWRPSDYFHALVERSPQATTPVGRSDKLAIKGWRPHTCWTRLGLRLQRMTGVAALARWMRRRRALRALRGAGA